MPEPTEEIAETVAKKRNGFGGRWWRVAAAAVLAGLAWLWYDMRVEVADLRQELAGKIREADSDSRDARAAARGAQDAIREAQAKIAKLEARLADSQSQQIALEALYQELSRGRDEWVLAEIEQILAIASQQLQLSGNVRAALVALQTAESRLARSERPQLLNVRRALARDIERLKAAPSVDVTGLTLRIDQLVSGVDALPLAYEERSPGVARDEPREEGFWSRLGGGILDELRQLVRVRNIEQPEAPLLSPSQGYFLRQNLRLRLLSARLALLERNETLLRADLQAANDWLARYFDPRSKAVQTATATLKQLSSSAVSGEMPTVAESLAAVRGFKLVREKSSP